MDIKDNIAIVTGAAKEGRLGEAIALALSERGAHILVHYLHENENPEAALKKIRAHGVRAASLQADTAQADVGTQLVRAAKDTLGKTPRILINSGAPFPSDSVRTFDPDTMTATVHAILRGPALLMQAFASELPQDKEGAGVIVNIIDVRVGARPYADHFSYGAAKAALREATFEAARELAPAVRVNAISPGVILPAAGSDKAHHEQVLASVPLGREGGVHAITQAVINLIEHDYLTGVDLPVDGGVRLT